MASDQFYTTEEVANLLKVSKLTVYDLIKKGKLPARRVGRQMRIASEDLERFMHTSEHAVTPIAERSNDRSPFDKKGVQPVIISGQDIALDVLAKHLEKRDPAVRPLRTYAASMNGLVGLYSGECDIVSLHLFDGDSGEYNLPFVQKLLIGFRYIVFHLAVRRAGFYVQKGNPKGLTSWEDLKRKDIQWINREKGSGARVLFDEQLRIRGISPESINGYDREESDHVGVASAVARGEADAGVGREKTTKVVAVDFIPLIDERYDLVMLKTPQNASLINLVRNVLVSDAFKRELDTIGGYRLTDTGKVLYEN